MPIRKRLLSLVLLLLVGACAAPPAPPPPVEPPPPAEPAPPRVRVPWEELEGWRTHDPRPMLEAFRTSCRPLKRRPDWEEICAAAERFPAPTAATARLFFEALFEPYRLQKPDGSATGLVTGYYVPDLEGSRTPTDRYRWPLYGVPDDLLVVDLREVYPKLGDYRLRGRLEGRRVVPYYSREQINASDHLEGEELFWVDDRVELFFLHIQGSGRINLPDGDRAMVNYADQNGHPYRSIGKLLLERGAMTRDQMSMQNIRAWARDNPHLADDLLAENPSYVFFRELPDGAERPYGALGVQLTAERSLAVDPRTTPLGAPVYLATTWPSSDRPLRRLMVAQDTGGAIKGPVRSDFYWGVGDEAGAFAGRMKQKGRMWVLLPKGDPASPQATLGQAED